MTFYNPRHFRVDDREALERFIAAHAFGALVSAGRAGLSVSHLPFLPERGASGQLRLLGHMARANGHWQELESAGEVLAIFEGPHAYVSPGWYADHPSVPTWNYVVVHGRGTARLLPPAELPPLLDRLSRAYEDGRPAPWRMNALPPDYTPRLLEAIVGFEIRVERLEGKFKLSQNRRGEDVARVAAALEAEGQGQLAAFMRAQAAPPLESR
ncbi:MAG TPA: FMN-binding negative transcriptional regulator [Usitatibacteraceae bacterium]|nr:FMN-binding negative transcriptional regulator [Usitatibacteraceae bacterium]